MGVHVIEIVHMGYLMIDLSFIHDMIHSHVPFVLGKKLGGRAGDYYGSVYIEIVRIGYLIIDMGWLQSVGSSKLQVSFVKEPYKSDDILRKRPIILRSLLIEDIPYGIHA